MYATCFFECYSDLQDLHSFPTRRSSDLGNYGVMNYRNFFYDKAVEQLGLAINGGRTEDGDVITGLPLTDAPDRKSTRLNSSHGYISYAVFCLKKKKKRTKRHRSTTQLMK